MYVCACICVCVCDRNMNERQCALLSSHTGLAEIYRFAKRIYAALTSKHPTTSKLVQPFPKKYSEMYRHTLDDMKVHLPENIYLAMR